MLAAMPKLAEVYLPLLIATATTTWPSAVEPWVMAAQIEKETCISLTHSKCWSPRAELKTSRENGIGFGQFTRAYTASGDIRFDKISELRDANPKELSGWGWENRYDPEYQMKALILADAKSYARFASLAATPMDAWRFTLSGYNGGDSAVLKSRLMCKAVKGCDPGVWYDNVELYSNKSRVKWQGYGQSAHDINRGYVRRIEARAPFYRLHWEKKNE